MTLLEAVLVVFAIFIVLELIDRSGTSKRIRKPKDDDDPPLGVGGNL